MVEVVTKSGTNQLDGQLFGTELERCPGGQNFHQQFVTHLVRDEFGGNLAKRFFRGRVRPEFFASVSLGGATLRNDLDSNKELCGKPNVDAKGQTAD